MLIVSPQNVAQLILCICVIVAFIRPLDALVVDRKFGVLSIIMMRLKVRSVGCRSYAPRRQVWRAPHVISLAVRRTTSSCTSSMRSSSSSASAPPSSA